jgi:hypothetical protein
MVDKVTVAFINDFFDMFSAEGFRLHPIPERQLDRVGGEGV